jgi:hypothetical protein
MKQTDIKTAHSKFEATFVAIITRTQNFELKFKNNY